MKIFTARALLPDSGALHQGGGLLVHRGRVSAVARSRDQLRRLVRDSGAPLIDLGEGLITPGLVNAHAHLELTALAGEVSPQGGLAAWIGRLMEQRAASGPERIAAGVARGAEHLLGGGTTLVGDVDSTGIAARVLARHPLRSRLYREALDAGDPGRTEAAWTAVAAPLDPAPRRAEGLAPHAPYTVTPALLERLATLARQRRLPVTIHWSETEAELEWMGAGTGPLAALLGNSPRRSGLDLIEAAGLLGPRTSLVHGNHPQDGEIERIARAGATLVHCPGTHLFFERGTFPLERYRAAGVRLALGSDSLASNTELDMGREMALLRRAQPALDPGEVWTMATLGGACALGYGGSTGRLGPGRWADFCLIASEARDLDTHLEILTAGRPPMLGVWVAGERAQAPTGDSGGAAPPADR